MNDRSFIVCHNGAMSASAKSTRRTAARLQRRQQLIDATINCIARNGMSSTSIADVAQEAGLSQGIVNLHFKTKENLLNETLQFLSDEYQARFDAAIDKAGPLPEDKLYAVMDLDFRPSICDRHKLAVWFAFYGEVKFHPDYRRICKRHDDYYDSVVRELCERIIADGDYKHITATTATMLLSATTIGLWLDSLVYAKTFDRREARAAVELCLNGLFPKHFPPDDPVLH